jgi:RNA binding exosome subunit
LTVVDIANLNFRTFAQATEDLERVEKALRYSSGATDISRSTNTGYHGNPITILEVRVSDSKRIKAVFRALGEEGLKTLLRSLDLRMDEESNFFFRLDKQDAYLEKAVLAEGEDVIAVRAKVKSYPQSRSNALETMRRFLETELERLVRPRE